MTFWCLNWMPRAFNEVFALWSELQCLILSRPPDSPSQLPTPNHFCWPALLNLGLHMCSLVLSQRLKGGPMEISGAVPFLMTWSVDSSCLRLPGLFSPVSSVPHTVLYLGCTCFCVPRFAEPGRDLGWIWSSPWVSSFCRIVPCAVCCPVPENICIGYFIWFLPSVTSERKSKTCNFIRVITRLQCFQPKIGTFKNWEISH